MVCWVIKNKDGEIYHNCDDSYYSKYEDINFKSYKFCNISIFKTKKEAKETAEWCELKNYEIKRIQILD